MEIPVAAINGAVKQFGIGILVAAVFGVAVVRMYADLERKNDNLLLLVREQIETNRDVSESIRELARSIGDQK